MNFMKLYEHNFVQKWQTGSYGEESWLKPWNNILILMLTFLLLKQCSV